LIPAPLPPNEDERLEALRLSCLLDTPPEQIFDDLTALAATLFDVPTVLISLVDRNRQFFKSAVGVAVRETSRDFSFCAHALLSESAFVVPDTCLDERFRDNPVVTGEPEIRFYAGATLVTKEGHRLGTFCIMDRKPRSVTPAQIVELQRFAALTSGLIEQRALQRKLRDDQERFALDPLTGLHNRASLLEQLQWRVDRQASHRHSFGLLFVDLDGFKRVNDSLRHRRGDLLLVEIGRRLEHTVRSAPGSLVARLGGDEFVVLVDEAEAAEDVLTVAYLLEYLLSAPIHCDGHEVFISASVGCVFGGSTPYTRAEQVLEDADLAMYRAKMLGKAQTALYSDKMRREALLRMHIETDLRRALERAEFEVWYQPKVRLGSGTIKGFEALLRWRHPVRGLVGPMDFIPLAEEIGLIG